MNRRFHAGDAYEVDGLRFRVRPGSKQAASGVDLVLEMQSASGSWVPVRMVLGFFLADFFYENEEVLYPQAHGKLGGKKYLNACRDAAVRRGWQRQWEFLELERRYRQRDLFDGEAS